MCTKPLLLNFTYLSTSFCYKISAKVSLSHTFSSCSYFSQIINILLFHFRRLLFSPCCSFLLSTTVWFFLSVFAIYNFISFFSLFSPFFENWLFFHRPICTGTPLTSHFKTRTSIRIIRCIFSFVVPRANRATLLYNIKKD